VSFIHFFQSGWSLADTIKGYQQWLNRDWVTGNHGKIYCATPVWMTNTMGNQLNSQHFRVLRAAFKDRKWKISRETLDRLSGRVTSTRWAKYIVSSTTVKMMQFATPMEEKLRQRILSTTDAPEGEHSSRDQSYRLENNLFQIGSTSLER